MNVAGTNAVEEIQNAADEHTWEIKDTDGSPDKEELVLKG